MSLTDYVAKMATGIAMAGVLAGPAYAQQPENEKRVNYFGTSDLDINEDGRPDEFAIEVFNANKDGTSKRYKVVYAIEGGKGAVIDEFALPSSVCLHMYIPADVNGDGNKDMVAMFGNCDKTGKYDKRIYLNNRQGGMKKQ